MYYTVNVYIHFICIFNEFFEPLVFYQNYKSINMNSRINDDFGCEAELATITNSIFFVCKYRSPALKFHGDTP